MASSSAQSTNGASSRNDAVPPPLNIFGTRARRYSTSFSPLAGGTGPRLTPRVSQLRQEECADITNSREVTHEREIHTALQISQSWEDLSLDIESFSVKSDADLTHPLHVTTMSSVLNGFPSCSSPSPTNRTIRIPSHVLSPSPTRRTFATRRSMSPIAMRPSSLGPVKRKIHDIEDSYSTYSPPPFKKKFSERGNSPSSLTCPSPDSTEGRTTPKLYVSKLYTNSTTSSSLSSSPSTTSAPSPSMEIPIDLGSINPVMHHEPMIIGDHDDTISNCSSNNGSSSVDGNVDKLLSGELDKLDVQIVASEVAKYLQDNVINDTNCEVAGNDNNMTESLTTSTDMYTDIAIGNDNTNGTSLCRESEQIAVADSTSSLENTIIPDTNATSN